MADEWPVNFAIRAVKDGISANRALEELKAQGIGIRRQDWLALVREVRGNLDARVIDTDRAGNQRPRQRDLLVMSTAIETGYIQQIDVYVKEHDTGDISIRPFSVVGDDLVTHDDAIQQALDWASDNAGRYGETILGATYTGTYVMVPRRSA